MTASIRIIIAQQNFLVGDIAGNARKIMDTIQQAKAMQGDVVVFPELALTGYSPEDLLLRQGMHGRIEDALKAIADSSQGIISIVGHPHQMQAGLYNAASILKDGKTLAIYHKRYLPNTEVFDEKRYFLSGEDVRIIEIKGVPFAITICEDIWQKATMEQAKAQGAHAMIVLNASPFHYQKAAQRRELMFEQARRGNMPIVYVNLVGGQDELVFDGGSFAVNADGDRVMQAPFFKESILSLVCEVADHNIHLVQQTLIPMLSEEEKIYQALVLGLKDYAEKNRFKRVLIGLSGGVDSALTAAIAVDALGAERVHGVLMPSRYTRDMSIEDATLEAQNLGISHQVISIEPVFSSFLALLKEPFHGLPEDTTEENLQARCRGMILMALSNKFGHLVLATGNKSEFAVGYSTLYGDMVGGFCPLKDIWKTFVYRLAHYRNGIGQVIPERVLTRAPSAELAANQVDQDSLPPYDILDQILYYYIEQDEEIQTIIARGFDEKTVKYVVRMVNRNEYKRRQAPIGICITPRAFGRNRRYPITSGYE